MMLMACCQEKRVESTAMKIQCCEEDKEWSMMLMLLP